MFDSFRLNRIDGFELIALSIFMVGDSLEDVLRNIVENLCDFNENEVCRELFFYYWDGFFRSMTKLYRMQTEEDIVAWRMNYLDLEEFTDLIYGKKEKMELSELVESFSKEKFAPQIEFLQLLKSRFNSQLKFSTNKNISVKSESPSSSKKDN